MTSIPRVGSGKVVRSRCSPRRAVTPCVKREVRSRAGRWPAVAVYGGVVYRDAGKGKARVWIWYRWWAGGQEDLGAMVKSRTPHGKE
jgi:hypothetical protein